jgi:hypothetical protein
MVDKPGETPKEAPASKSAGSGQDLAAGLVTFTLDTSTGRIVGLELVDGSGARRQATAEERRALVRKAGGATLEHIFEQTFEAGIVSVLGDDVEDEEDEEAAEETPEDATIRHLILAPMIERSAASRLMRRDVLGRAVLATFVQDMVGEAPSPEPRAAPRGRGASTGGRRAPGRPRAQH